MIPEAIAFSGIAGVDPRVGLFGAFLLSVTLAVVGGRTAMITSATGSTALLMTGLVQQGNALGEGMGLQYLLAAGIVTGLLQIAWGYLHLAHQMRFVPQPVMAGFVNALAILIAQAQLPQLGLDWFHPEEVPVTAAQLPAVWGLMALTLAITFSLYAVIKKRGAAGSRLGLTAESALLAPIALIWLCWQFDSPTAAFGGSWTHGLWLLGAGFATTVPLLLFGYSTRNIRLTTLGMIQFIGPTIQLFIGWRLYNEPMPPTRLLSFALIWAAIAIYSWDGVTKAKTT